MTQSSVPPSPPLSDDVIREADYIAAADEFAAVPANESEDEDNEDEEDSEGGDGKGGGGRKPKSLKDYDVKIDRALFDLSSDTDLEPLAALLEIMGKLKLAAPSEIIKGSSMTGPEYPEIALRELGLQTLKLDAQNIADPDLLKKLDQKQRELRQRENIPHPDDILLRGEGQSSAGGIAAAAIGLVAATMADTDKPQERNRQRREDAKFEKRQEREAATKPEAGTFGTQTYQDELMTPASEPDLSDIVDMFDRDDDLQFDKPEEVPAFADSLDRHDRGIYATGATDLAAITGFFNYVSSQVQAPVERVDLRADMRFERQESVLPATHLDI
jgi:hypothetical protein